MSSELNLFFSTFLKLDKQERIELHILVKKFNNTSSKHLSIRQFCSLWRKTYPNLIISKSHSKQFCYGVTFIECDDKIQVESKYFEDEEGQESEPKVERIQSERNLLQLELDRVKLELEIIHKMNFKLQNYN